jgi:hypothetical protein
MDMKKGPLGRRYEVHLPIAVRARGANFVTGVTEFMSSRDVRFRLKKAHALTPGTALTLYVSLPSGGPQENQVLVCARGRVLNVKRTSRLRTTSTTLTAAMDSYDFLGLLPAPPPRPGAVACLPGSAK